MGFGFGLVRVGSPVSRAAEAAREEAEACARLVQAWDEVGPSDLALILSAARVRRGHLGRGRSRVRVRVKVWVRVS